MLFCFITQDSLPATAIREEFRPQHRDYLKSFASQISFAGPLLDKDQNTVVGSLLVMDFHDRDAATNFIENEPYTKEGLFQKIDILGFENRWPQKTGFPA
ncbi:MAG: YciI family protein [Gammaproteobacteria bacterium]|nr:YciI family protein [Gammaproteobacteria bacterium]